MRTIREAVQSIADELETKGQMYGKTYLQVAQALGEKPQFSILVRMFEKMFRIKHILKTAPQAEAALASEFKEIAAYAILAIFESDRS